MVTNSFLAEVTFNIQSNTVFFELNTAFVRAICKIQLLLNL